MSHQGTNFYNQASHTDIASPHVDAASPHVDAASPHDVASSETTMIQDNGRDIVLTIDISGSMNQYLYQLLIRATDFLHKQKTNFEGQDVYLTIVVFADVKDIQVKLPRMKLSEFTSIPYMTTKGSTALYSAIKFADNMFQSGEYKGRQIFHYVITDGFENASQPYDTLDTIKPIVQKYLKSIKEAPATSTSLIFIAANQKAETTAETFGLPKEYAMTFQVEASHGCFEAMGEQMYRVSKGLDSTPSVIDDDRLLSCPMSDYNKGYSPDEIDSPCVLDRTATNYSVPSDNMQSEYDDDTPSRSFSFCNS